MRSASQEMRLQKVVLLEAHGVELRFLPSTCSPTLAIVRAAQCSVAAAAQQRMHGRK